MTASEVLCQPHKMLGDSLVPGHHNPFGQHQESTPLKSEVEPALIAVVVHSMHLQKPLLNLH